MHHVWAEPGCGLMSASVLIQASLLVFSSFICYTSLLVSPTSVCMVLDDSRSFCSMLFLVHCEFCGFVYCGNCTVKQPWCMCSR